MPYIRVPQLPVTAQKLCVYTRWTSGLGQFVEATRFLAPDGKMLRDVGPAAGVTMGRWSWGSNFIDINNDGWQDLIVGNGYISGADPNDL